MNENIPLLNTAKFRPLESDDFIAFVGQLLLSVASEGNGNRGRVSQVKETTDRISPLKSRPKFHELVSVSQLRMDL